MREPRFGEDQLPAQFRDNHFWKDVAVEFNDLAQTTEEPKLATSS